MLDPISIIFTVAVTAFVVNIAIASYGIFVKHSLMKKILSLIVFSDSVNILAISLGFRVVEHGYPSPPVISEIPQNPEDLEVFASVAVDPLPQAFVLTAIVIGFAITIYLLGLVVVYYNHFKTDDIRVSFREDEDEEDV